MKRAARSYISFTRNERMGIICLCALLIILIGIRVTMVYWVHPTHNKEEEQKLLAAWQVYQRSQPKPIADSVKNDQAEYADRTNDDEAPLPAIININTADSATIVRLKGIGPAMTHKILIYRQQHPLKNIAELLEIQSIPHTTFDLLKKHLTTDSANQIK